MAFTKNLIACTTLLLVFFITTPTGVRGSIGVCYGKKGTDLPPPNQVVALFKSQNITRMRIYEPHNAVLRALNGSNIELSLGVRRQDLFKMANSTAAAAKWVRRNVLSYWPGVRFRYIVAGNEIIPMDGAEGVVLPAMRNIYDALSSAGLAGRIRVSTSVKFNVLCRSFPPSAGEFCASALPYMRPIIRFLSETRTPLMANVYPFFSYIENPGKIPLSYALFTSRGTVVRDGRYRYQNLFDAMVDALYSAIERVEASLFSAQLSPGDQVGAAVTETGQPHESGGAPKPPAEEETATNDRGFLVSDRTSNNPAENNAATVENARIYNTNLIRHVRRGTPRRPGKPIEAYIFAMFDENKKQPHGIENYWGMFYPNMTHIYPIRFY